MTATDACNRIVETIEAMPLPLGCAMERGDAFESSRDVRTSLARQLPMSFLIMFAIAVLSFMLRQRRIIRPPAPVSLNRVVLGLPATGRAFSFAALPSLSGMPIKNGFVRVEEIDIVHRDGWEPFTAVIEAWTPRLRPVVLAAATTNMGMIPSLTDTVFTTRAATIMGALAFATVLTLIAAPGFRCVFHRGARRCARSSAAMGQA